MPWSHADFASACARDEGRTECQGLRLKNMVEPTVFIVDDDEDYRD